MVIETKIKKYNNKSRKGTYVYIKEKGKKPSILKYKKGTSMGLYVLYYKDRTDKRRKLKAKSFSGYVKSQKEIKSKIRKKVRRGLSDYYKKGKNVLDKEIRRGIVQTQIEDILTSDYNVIKRKVKEMLEPIVLDKGLLGILTQDSNLEKLKTRFTYKVELIGTSGQTIATVNSIAKYKPNDFVNIIKRNLKKGERIKYKESLNNVSRNIGQGLVHFREEGILNKVKMKIFFTKEKQSILVN